MINCKQYKVLSFINETREAEQNKMTCEITNAIQQSYRIIVPEK